MRVHSTFLFLLVWGGALAQTPPAETPAAHVVRYAEEAAADPLTSASAEKRAAAMQFVEDDHQTHVLLCPNVFNQIRGNNGKNAHEITLQYLISAAAFLYQHPESSSDMNAQNTAGLAAAARVYEKFVEAERKSHSKFLDTVVQQQAGGTLKDFVAKTCK